MRFASQFPSNSGVSRKHLLSFAFGITFGFSIAHILMNVVTWNKTDKFWSSLCTLSHFDAIGDIREDGEMVPEGPYSAVSHHKMDEEFHEGMRFQFDSLECLIYLSSISKKYIIRRQTAQF